MPHEFADELITLGRDDADGFDIALRRRSTPSGDVDELIVNGMFAMDSTDASSELALAELVPAGSRRVMVGGLGLGFTAGAVLDDHPEAVVEVVELSSGLFEWARQGLTAGLKRVADDPRAELVHSDIKDVLVDAERAGRYDAVLLDVDNGPSFLIHDHNQSLYGHDLLAAAVQLLAPGGLLAIWCERHSDELDARLRALDADVDEVIVGVDRDGHHIDYAIHIARRPR